MVLACEVRTRNNLVVRCGAASLLLQVDTTLRDFARKCLLRDIATVPRVSRLGCIGGCLCSIYMTQLDYYPVKGSEGDGGI